MAEISCIFLRQRKTQSEVVEEALDEYLKRRE